jgi:peptide chain release factor 1
MGTSPRCSSSVLVAALHREQVAYRMCREKVDAKRNAQRRSLVGTGDRSERIRSFNFQENRVTDHRIGLTLFGVEDMLAGLKLHEFASHLKTKEQMDRLLNLTEALGQHTAPIQ